MDPHLSNDVLTRGDARALAIAVREAVLIGKVIHPLEVERLCCFVIKTTDAPEITKPADPFWAPDGMGTAMSDLGVI